MAFISYYFHWSEREVLGLSHGQRRRWCSEISSINRELGSSKKEKRKEKSIFDMRPDR